MVVTDVPQGATPEQTAPLIRLFMLVNDVSLRNLIPGELAKGFGFLQSKGQTAFSPVAVTPDELGAAFDGEKVHLPLLSQINGKPFGRPNAGVDMTFDFPTLIAHAVKTRPLKGGAIIGSGTVSNRDADGGPGKPGARRRRGLFVPGRNSHRRDDPAWRAEDAISQLRRPCADRDERRAGAFDLRRHRPRGGAGRLRASSTHAYPRCRLVGFGGRLCR